MALFCIVCKIQRLISWKLRNFYTQPVFSAPERDDPVEISRSCLVLIKPERSSYRAVKNITIMLNRFHTIPERNSQFADARLKWNIAKRFYPSYFILLTFCLWTILIDKHNATIRFVLYWICTSVLPAGLRMWALFLLSSPKIVFFVARWTWNLARGSGPPLPVPNSTFIGAEVWEYSPQNCQNFEFWP